MKPKIKRQRTHALLLTKFELLHIRDLFSISLPGEGSKTLSQALAEAEDRTIIESAAWTKIVAACDEVGIPTGDAAPDYIVAPSGMPVLGVFQVASEPPGSDSSAKGTPDE